jgi:antitoxin component YwqK of YwqJK toxin-antitoxin module
VYDTHGNITSTSISKDGKLDGKSYFYSNGYVTAVKIYKNGMLLKEIRYDYRSQTQMITTYLENGDDHYNDENIIRTQRKITEKTLKRIMPDAIDRINQIEVGKKYKMIRTFEPEDKVYTVVKKIHRCLFKLVDEDYRPTTISFIPLIPIE